MDKSLWGIGVVIVGIASGVLAEELHWQEMGLGDADIRSITVDSRNGKKFYAGVKNGVMVSEDAGASWKNILLSSGIAQEVAFVTVNVRGIFVGTNKGLLFSADQGVNWNKLFKGKGDFENACTALLVLSDKLFLGTKSGLWVSKDNGKTWERETGKLAHSHILAIAHTTNHFRSIYVVSVGGVFRSKTGGRSWERSMASHALEDIEESSNGGEENADEEIRNTYLRNICIDPKNPKRLLLSTRDSIFESKDQGDNWYAFSTQNLIGEITYLYFTAAAQLFVSTTSGG
ncbi:MAG: hypothetical protein KKC84_06675, partial [Candidatus Omnitrophica bacterium]|nr:hypothetical protein [Candidatus Omnitrophota bacterium]